MKVEEAGYQKFKGYDIKRIVFAWWADSYRIAYNWSKVLTAFNLQNLFTKIDNSFRSPTIDAQKEI